MLYNKVVSKIEYNKEVKEGGGHIGIPYPLPRFSEHLPLIDKGQSIGILGATGSGKSRISRYLYIYTPYKFFKQTGYKVKIFYFPLEDNKEKVYRNLICNYLFEVHDIIISPDELMSKRKPLPAFVLSAVKEAEAYFADLEKVVEFIDGLHKPKEIYDFLEDYALKTGKPRKVTRINEEGQTVTDYFYESDTHTIVIIDNLSNLDDDPEDGIKSEREAMTKLAKFYIREKLVNYFNFTVVQVLQLDFQSERQQYTHSGMTIISKLEPSLAGIGEAKTVARSMHLVLGLFDPSRYELIQYPIPSRQDPENCYRIDLLGNKFRALKVLKNNDGEAGLRIGLLFNALSETLTELPLPKTPELNNIYKSLTGKSVNNSEILHTFDDNLEDTDEIPF